MRAMIASILLVLALTLYPAPASAFEPPPDRPYASPRYFFVEDAEPPMRLRDQHGREIDLAATGWKRSGYGYEVWIPRLIPGA